MFFPVAIFLLIAIPSASAVNREVREISKSIEAIIYYDIKYVAEGNLLWEWSAVTLDDCIAGCIKYGLKCRAVNYHKTNCKYLNAGIVNFKGVSTRFKKLAEGHVHAYINRKMEANLPPFPSPVTLKPIVDVDPCMPTIFRNTTYLGEEMRVTRIKPRSALDLQHCVDACVNYGDGYATTCKSVNYRPPFCHYFSDSAVENPEQVEKHTGYIHVYVDCYWW